MDEELQALTLDSWYFTILELLCDEMRLVLAEDNMNITQYRVLLSLYEAPQERNRVSDVAHKLQLEPNVVTQAANALEVMGLVQRSSEDGDRRARILSVTDTGVLRIRKADAALSEHLYSLLNPMPEEMFRLVQESIITIGAGFEGAFSPIVQRTSVVSLYLGALTEAERHFTEALRLSTGASFNECRVLQRLHEASGTMRIMDLARTLALPSHRITRIADRLEARGLIRRVSDTGNSRAVLLEVTVAGRLVQETIMQTIVATAKRHFWSQLDARHQDAVQRGGAVVLAAFLDGSADRRHGRYSLEVDPR